MDIKSFYESERYKAGFVVQERPHVRDTVTLRLVREHMRSGGGVILDVGAGTGYILRQLEGFHGHAIELAEPNAAYLRSRGFETHSIDLNTQAFPYADATFDCVVFNEVIEHLFDPQHVLDEIHRVLKPAGLAIVHTHNSFNIYMRLKYLMGRIPAEALDVSGRTHGEHIHVFNYRVLDTLVARAGFQRRVNTSWTSIKKKVAFLPRSLTGLLSRFLCIRAYKA
jgi:2-polyprenyl-3-methyl-5-hydroxy-6-metoxy-1,4-benzoquinol methylase